MREIVSSVTSRGQVTIPATVRRHLGVGTPDKVAFVLNDDGSVSLKPITLTMADLRGVLPPLPGGTSVDFEAEIEEAMEERAEQLVARMRRQ